MLLTLKLVRGDIMTSSKGDKKLGARIKELREKKNYTQEQLAEMLELDARSLSRIETGVSFTTIDRLKKMADIFDVELKELFATDHYDDKQQLIKKINQLLDSASIENIRTIYKIVSSMLR